VDVALIQHAQDDVDDDECGRDQIRLAGQRRLEGLGVALEASTQRGWHVELGLRLFDRLYGLTEGDVRRQIEAQGYRGELPLMIDGQERGWRVCPFRERAQAHLVSGDRRLDVDPVERLLGILQFRQHFLDHVIAVQLGEVLRDLALAERVIQRIVDQLRLDPETARPDPDQSRGSAWCRLSADRSRRP